MVCLQQTHCVSLADCTSWFSSSGFLSRVSPGSNHSRGRVILYRPSFSLVDSWSDADGRLLQYQFSFYGKSFRACCLYAPNRNPDRDQFLENVSHGIDPSVPTLLVGDFNTVFDRLKDRRGSDPLDSSRESSLHLSACLTLAVSLISGGTFTPTLLALLGPGGMALKPPELTSSVYPMFGCPLFPPVTFFPHFFLTIVLFFCRCLFLMLFPLVLDCGN